MGRREKLAAYHRTKAEENVSMEAFVVAIMKFKEANNLTWAQMDARAGRSPGVLNSYRWGGRKYVSRAVAEDILGRLNGHSKAPTRLQQAEYTDKARKDQANQRAETLRDNKLQERKAKVAELRKSLGALRLDKS